MCILCTCSSRIPCLQLFEKQPQVTKCKGTVYMYTYIYMYMVIRLFIINFCMHACTCTYIVHCLCTFTVCVCFGIIDVHVFPYTFYQTSYQYYDAVSYYTHTHSLISPSLSPFPFNYFSRNHQFTINQRRIRLKQPSEPQ